MAKKRHSLSGATYESDAEGVVLVTNRAGLEGRFDSQGQWIDGELREADPQMCLWLAGRRLPTTANRGEHRLCGLPLTYSIGGGSCISASRGG